MAGFYWKLTRRDFLKASGALGLGWMASGCTADNGVVTTLEPRQVPDPIDFLITRWRQDPFARGSYSFMAVGADLEDRASLRQPVAGRLFFAGEATDSDSPATVDGAVESGRRAAAEVTDTDASTIAVIGGGVAGLAAAQALAAIGRSVTLLEARDRLGGRVFTDRSLGVPLDLGASWIHGAEENPVTLLADAVAADRLPTDYDNHVVRNASGTVLRDSQLSDSFEEVTEIEHEYGADVDELSPDAEEEGGQYEGEDMVFPEGYDQILEGLAGDYDTKLSFVVNAIDHSGEGVGVSSAEETSTFDAVIITVPLGVLKVGSITFIPELPPENQGAIDRLGMGLLNKVYLRFEEVFWDAEADLLGYDGPRRGYFAEWLNIAKVTGQPILLGFNASSAADEIEALSDEEIVAEAMAALRAMYGDMK